MPPIGNITCQPINSTTDDSSNIGKDDLNALLYIVVTLLFYSMGIIIGIITYLKREQAEMEEDKMFDMYMQIKREPFNLYKRERVQQMALYLKQVEEQQAAREKIESWRVAEHMQRFQPCRRHGYRHSSCPDCSKTSPIPEICHGFDEATALAISDGNWPESGGGTALLCSLTLGVCEPLLTPESIKRVAFPDSSHADGKSLSSSAIGASMIRPYPCVPVKSAFRQASLTVHYTDKPAHQQRDARIFLNTSNEVKHSYMKDLPPETHFDNPSMFDKGDIELKELRQFNYDEVKAVFQKNAGEEGQSRYACDNVFADTQIIPFFNKRSASPTTTSENCATLLQQLSSDRKCSLSELAVHASVRVEISPETSNKDDCQFVTLDQPLKEDGLASGQQATSAASQTEVTDSTRGDPDQLLVKTEELFASRDSTEDSKSPPGENSADRDVDASGDIKRVDLEQHQHQQQPQQLYQEQTQLHLQQVRPEMSYAIPPVIIPSTIAFHNPQKCELPLHLFVLTPQQVQSSPARPQVFVPISSIPQAISRDVTAAICAGSPNSIVPQSTQNVHTPLYGTWKKPTSQSVDISDVTRARQLGLNWKSKTLDKKGTGRAQPERRGALFFTQRSLQKDSDSTKSLNSRKLSRPSAFSRQESFDSHTSRTSDISEGIDSPLLQSISGIETGVSQSSPGSSVGSNTVSPLEAVKHSKRPVSLVGSQTEESPKLVPE